MTKLRKPRKDEYAPYYETYVGKISDPDFLKQLVDLRASTIKFLSNLTEEQWNHRYAPGKWSVKELMIHILDTERVFSYRALRIARNDSTPLAGFEQDDYIPFYNVDNRSPQSIIAEYKAIRNSTIHLFQNLSTKDLDRKGTASGSAVSVLGLAFIIIGHETHHCQILKERYFPE